MEMSRATTPSLDSPKDFNTPSYYLEAGLHILMLQFAAYRSGKGLIDAGIRLFSYSLYHHIALRLTAPVTVEFGGDQIFDLKAGTVIEARPGGVKRLKSISDQHTPGEVVDFFEYKIPLTHYEIQVGTSFLVSQLGKAYDWLNDVRFIPGIRLMVPTPAGSIWDRKHVYCSELAVEMSHQIKRPILERVPAWKVPPGDVPKSPLLKLVGTETSV